MIRRNQVTAGKKRLLRNAITQFWELSSYKQKSSSVGPLDRETFSDAHLVPPSMGTRVKWLGREVDHSCPMPRLGMSGAVPILPLSPPWRGQ